MSQQAVSANIILNSVVGIFSASKFLYHLPFLLLVDSVSFAPLTPLQRITDQCCGTGTGTGTGTIGTVTF
jgi:hypothetical protein